MLDRLVASWSEKEARRDRLVPESFDTAEQQRRVRLASVARVLFALVFVALAFVLFAASRLSTTAQVVAAAVLGALLAVTLGLALVALTPLARAELDAREALDSSAAVVGAGDERAVVGEGVDLEHEHGVQPDDVQREQ